MRRANVKNRAYRLLPRVRLSKILTMLWQTGDVGGGSFSRRPGIMSFSHALLVDDDPVYRALAEDIVLDCGVKAVDMAESGHEALSKLAGGLSPDLLLCDLNMPVHDGVSLIRSLAEQRFAGKVVIISSETDAIIEAVARLAKMQGLNILGSIRKPLTSQRLSELLARGLERVPVKAVEAPAEPVLLDAAIVGDGLRPLFQAKVSMSTGRIVGAEALARIAGRGGDLISPVAYVTLAERNNRIDDLTYTLARRVARQAASFLIDGRPMPVAINISPLSLTNLAFPDRLASILESEGLLPSQMKLEVTETRVLECGAATLDVFARLAIKGFGLSVDDFGTGASNIDRLQMFPFTELKIDQIFTRNALTDRFARASVEMSIRLAREAGLNIVAEGVETADMWSLLCDLGVDEAQGYLLSRPLAPDVFTQLLARGVTLPPVLRSA